MSVVEQELTERARARVEVEQRRAFERLETYIPIANPVHVVIKKLAPFYERMDRIHRGEQLNILLAAPARSTKTTTVFHAVARKLRVDPRWRYGYGTYNVTFAREQSIECRAMAARAGVWAGEVTVEDDPAARFDRARSTVLWQTPAGGGGKFVGRGGSAIGAGFNLTHIDDPVKGDDEMLSDTIIEKTWSWMTAGMFSRSEPGGSIVVSHHRWADDDPIGRLIDTQKNAWHKLSPEAQDMLEELKWEYLDFPAVGGAGDPAVDELFVPEDEHEGWEWFSRATLVFKKTQNEIAWEGMWQQRPPRRGAKMFPEAFPEWSASEDVDGNPHGLVVNGEWFPVPDLARCVLRFSADTAGTEGGGDWTALSLQAFFWVSVPNYKDLLLGSNVLRVWFEQLESPDVVDWVWEHCRSLPSVPIAYEDNGEGRAQLRFLRRQHPKLRVVEVKTDKSKRVRATACANGARGGRLLMPPRTDKNAHWLDETIRQIKGFTGKDGSTDDIPDSIVNGWNHALQLAPPTKGMVGGRAIGAHMPRAAKPESSIVVPRTGLIVPSGLAPRRSAPGRSMR